jgi:hypothetical protein
VIKSILLFIRWPSGAPLRKVRLGHLLKVSEQTCWEVSRVPSADSPSAAKGVVIRRRGRSSSGHRNRKADGGIAPSLCEASHAPPSANNDNMWLQKGTYTRVAGEVIE